MNALENVIQQTSTTSIAEGISIYEMVICMLVSLALGVSIALVYAWHERHTRSFTIALAIIPAIVCVVIAMVNGNVGTGVAVAGAFSLVRFRSAPGSGRDIAFVFLAMAVGLATGMGYLAIATIVTVIIGIAYVILSVLPFGKRGDTERLLTVSVPESIDYVSLFDGVLSSHTSHHEMLSVKTGAMGTIYKIRYAIGSLGATEDKALIDDIRCLNGNMEVAIMEMPTSGSNDL